MGLFDQEREIINDSIFITRLVLIPFQIAGAILVEVVPRIARLLILLWQVLVFLIRLVWRLTFRTYRTVILYLARRLEKNVVTPPSHV